MYSLSEDIIYKNKRDFIEIISRALDSREGSKKEELLKKLDSSDFYFAPASTKYHGSCRGGLVDHCLNVFYNMLSIAKSKHLLTTYNDEGTLIEEGVVDENSIAIVALLHDLSKMNYYQLDYRNKKVYCESGSKRDNGGRFDWIAVQSYSTIPVEERFLYGSHEATAEYMARQFVPLTFEESIAILHHHFSLSFDSTKDVSTVANIYNRYPIAVLLHIADTLSTYIDEKY